MLAHQDRGLRVVDDAARKPRNRRHHCRGPPTLRDKILYDRMRHGPAERRRLHLPVDLWEGLQLRAGPVQSRA